MDCNLVPTHRFLTWDCQSPIAVLRRREGDAGGGKVQRQAQLREDNGKLDLWMKDKRSFRRGTPEDEVWLEHFLSDVTSK
ncbi:MAG: hypothetical protein ABI042_03805 [Verrucomicrobiota bacterium]